MNQNKSVATLVERTTKNLKQAFQAIQADVKQLKASSLLNNPCIGGLFSGTFLTDFQSLLLPLETLLIFDETKQKCSYFGRANDKKCECI